MNARKSQPGLAPVVPIGVHELELLRRATYDYPYSPRGTHEVKIADALVAEGLLERSFEQVRQTDRGTEVAKPLSATRARLAVQEIRTAADEGDPELAAGIERRLHLRVLAELALSGERGDLARIALTSTSIAFRR